MTGGRAVVLGPTGRNFAAGMSGGLAFVFDEFGGFRHRINPTMVDQIEALDEADLIEVRELVEEHLQRTGSTVAQRILEDWTTLSQKFVKVFPTDYKRVLAELAEQEDANASPRADEFESETAEVIGGPDVRAGEGE